MNSTLYITTTLNADTPTLYYPMALEIPSGNYTGSSLALALQAELQFAAPDHQFVCTYNPSTGSITIISETIPLFNILTDLQVMTSTIPQHIIWRNKIGNDVYVDLYSLKPLNVRRLGYPEDLDLKFALLKHIWF